MVGDYVIVIETQFAIQEADQVKILGQASWGLGVPVHITESVSLEVEARRNTLLGSHVQDWSLGRRVYGP